MASEAAAVEEADPLLAELNAAFKKKINDAAEKTSAPSDVPSDPPIVQPRPLEDQLETTTPLRPPTAPKLPAATNLDKTHSKAAGGHGYKVWVAGDYFAASIDGKGKAVKKYELPFNLPALKNLKGESALGIIVADSKGQESLLRRALAKMDPAFKNFRTYEIVKVEPLNGAAEPTSLQYMSLESLNQYTKDTLVSEGFPIDPEEYWDVKHLKEDVIDFKTNLTSEVVDVITGGKAKGGFGLKKTAVDRIKERHAARVEDKQLSDMNEGL